MPQGSFFKPKFLDFMKREYLACMHNVGIIDISSFSKIEIKPAYANVRQFLKFILFLSKSVIFPCKHVFTRFMTQKIQKTSFQSQLANFIFFLQDKFSSCSI